MVATIKRLSVSRRFWAAMTVAWLADSLAIIGLGWPVWICAPPMAAAAMSAWYWGFWYALY